MTCHIGGGIIVCTGTGSWRVNNITCPWCKEVRRCLETPVFGGWEGGDYICGTCGQYWSSEGELRNIPDDVRQGYIARVAATPDPQCWKCHDSGDTVSPFDPITEDPDPCSCSAGDKLRFESRVSR